MNAAAHCVEALYASNATPVTTLLAAQGLQLMATALPRIAVDPSDLEARADALQGTWYSGWVLGATNMGLHHKLCHVLGGSYNLSHSAVHSAVLPYVTAWNASGDRAAMSQITNALESTDAADGLWDLANRAGAPTSLTDVGFDPGDIDAVATVVAASSPENPRPVTPEGVREILLASCAGIRPATG
jgi:alcohol dehydrogenase class IV